MSTLTAATARPSNRYYDRKLACHAVKILPGEYEVTIEDIAIVTVLGSCVSACVRDRRQCIGGMNHFMLPDAGGDASNPLSASARYGTYAMELLINELTKLGAHRSRLEAKVFGGGNVLRGLDHAAVGERNSAFVLGFLTVENVRLRARDLMDEFPRKVYFFPSSGRVMVRKLRTLNNDTVLKREREYRRELGATRVSGDVELFS